MFSRRAVFEIFELQRECEGACERVAQTLPRSLEVTLRPRRHKSKVDVILWDTAHGDRRKTLLQLDKLIQRFAMDTNASKYTLFQAANSVPSASMDFRSVLFGYMRVVMLHNRASSNIENNMSVPNSGRIAFYLCLVICNSLDVFSERRYTVSKKFRSQHLRLKCIELNRRICFLMRLRQR